MEEVAKFLNKAREQEKSFRAQISRVLEELEAYLMKEDTKMTSDGAELLFIGAKEKKVKGLVELCGLPGKFGSSLKNSSYTAMALIAKLLTVSSTNFSPRAQVVILGQFRESRFRHIERSEARASLQQGWPRTRECFESGQRN